jgi:hypothetical protein
LIFEWSKLKKSGAPSRSMAVNSEHSQNLRTVSS